MAYAGKAALDAAPSGRASRCAGGGLFAHSGRWWHRRAEGMAPPYGGAPVAQGGSRRIR